jgi:hypothetical protein
VIPGYRPEVEENFVLLGYYAARSGNSLPAFRGKLLVSSSRVKNPPRHIVIKVMATEDFASALETDGNPLSTDSQVNS